MFSDFKHIYIHTSFVLQIQKFKVITFNTDTENENT